MSPPTTNNLYEIARVFVSVTHVDGEELGTISVIPRTESGTNKNSVMTSFTITSSFANNETPAPAPAIAVDSAPVGANPTTVDGTVLVGTLEGCTGVSNVFAE